MTLDYNTNTPIVLSTARSMGVRLDVDDCHDIKVSLWESQTRFLAQYDIQERKLTEDENKHLRNRLFLRARGAIIDMLRFKSWAVRFGDGWVIPSIDRAPVTKTQNNFFDQFVEPSDPASVIEQQMLLKQIIDELPHSQIIREYLAGDTMKTIGIRRGVSEPRIHQIFQEIHAAITRYKQNVV